MSDSAGSADEERVGDRLSAHDPQGSAGGNDIDERPVSVVSPEELAAAVDALEGVSWQAVPGISAVTAATFTAEVAQARERVEARQERESGRCDGAGSERRQSR